MDYRCDGIASEDLTNLSVCVRKGVDIIPVKCKADLNGNLVLVDNIKHWNSNDRVFKIPKGEYVRYINITLLPKYYF